MEVGRLNMRSISEFALHTASTQEKKSLDVSPNLYLIHYLIHLLISLISFLVCFETFDADGSGAIDEQEFMELCSTVSLFHSTHSLY